MEKFIHSTASSAGNYYGIVYPKETIPAKLFVGIMAILLRLTPARGFRPYIHSTKKIREIVTSYNFKKIFHAKTIVWEILVFEKDD